METDPLSFLWYTRPIFEKIDSREAPWRGPFCSFSFALNIRICIVPFSYPRGESILVLGDHTVSLVYVSFIRLILETYGRSGSISFTFISIQEANSQNTFSYKLDKSILVLQLETIFLAFKLYITLIWKNISTSTASRRAFLSFSFSISHKMRILIELFL